MPGGDDPAGAAIEVWDVNWEAFCIFRACGSQWRVAVLPTAIIHLGLDYPGLEVLMRRLAPRSDHDALFADLIWQEAAALPILNEVSA